MEPYYRILFTGVLITLGLCICVTLYYIIHARLTVDRIIGINLIGTIVVDAIALLTFLLNESYLADVALVFVILSFLAVTMLCRIYINLYHKEESEKNA